MRPLPPPSLLSSLSLRHSFTNEHDLAIIAYVASLGGQLKGAAPWKRAAELGVTPHPPESIKQRWFKQVRAPNTLLRPCRW